MPKSAAIMATPVQSGFSKEELVVKLKGGEEGINSWNQWVAPLSGEERKKVDLTGADLSECHLTNADLWGINLQGAVLWDATFAGANLFNTNLRETDLCGADLSAAKGGLLSNQLAGADLTGARLPESLAKLYDKLDSVSDISDSAKKLFLALLAACLYSWLTIATTKDVDLITNRASSPLPVIQTAIPIVGFYVVAPLILLCIYFYFHFYLQKLWEELATLPAVFTDGRPLYARADPWLFNDLVRAHFPRLKQGRPFLSYFQQWISILLAWWIVPVTLLLFWGRYLPRHDLFWTIVLALLLAISMVSAIRLYQLASSTLRGDRRLSLAETVRTRNPWVILALVCVCSATFVMMSLGAMYGVPNRSVHNAPEAEAGSYGSPRTWVPLAMSWVGYDPFANLVNADVSIKPPDWTGKKDEELDRVKGVQINGRDLRYAHALGAFLPKSGLGSSDLSHADLGLADLRQAHLEGADLSSALLDGAQLEGASLRGADLSGVRWLFAEIRFTVLTDSRNLDLKRIKGADDWQLAFYGSDMLKQLGLPPDHNVALEDYQNSGSQEPFDSYIVNWRRAKQATPPKTN